MIVWRAGAAYAKDHYHRFSVTLPEGADPLVMFNYYQVYRSGALATIGAQSQTGKLSQVMMCKLG